MKNKLLTTLAVLACSYPQITRAQQVSLSGKVVDADGAPLSAVTLKVKNSPTTTKTNEKGLFTFNVPNHSVILISAIGYVTQEVNVADRNTLIVNLQTDNAHIDEVVVTALGIKRNERSLGYAAQKVSAEDLTVNKQSNVVNALQGKVAGVTISSTGGAPGQGAKIQIRGINSIDPDRDNNPLFVIDGILIDNSTSTSGNRATERGISNRAVDINPDDIETMNILKGGAATALYGLRGANGVVVITTKSGKQGKLRINYSGLAGFDKAN